MSDRKTRYCPHCREDVTYVVYKRHKGEFYDARKKEWTTSHVSLNRYMKELDAADDEEICNVLTSSYKGDLCIMVSFIAVITNLAIVPVCSVRVLKSYFLDIVVSISENYVRLSLVSITGHSKNRERLGGDYSNHCYSVYEVLLP